MKTFIPSLIIIIVDQITKLWVKYNFTLYETRNIFGDFLRFTYVENPGIAFGIRIGDFRILVTAISIFIAIYLAVFLYKTNISKFEKLSLSLILGGAIGNIIDRVLIYFPGSGYTGVIDFIDVGFNDFRWYIFNVADSSVSVGIVIYIFYSLDINRKISVKDA